MVHGIYLTCQMNWKEVETTYYTSWVVEKRVWTKETQELGTYDFYPSNKRIKWTRFYFLASKLVYYCSWTRIDDFMREWELVWRVLWSKKGGEGVIDIWDDFVYRMVLNNSTNIYYYVMLVRNYFYYLFTVILGL